MTCVPLRWRRRALPSLRALAEQDGAYLRIRHVHPARLLHADVHAALNRRPRAHRSEPALEMREARKRLGTLLFLLPLEQPDPADTGHISNRIAAGQEAAILQPRVHHAVEPVQLV